jgi:hypothetical protein
VLWLHGLRCGAIFVVVNLEEHGAVRRRHHLLLLGCCENHLCEGRSVQATSDDVWVDAGREAVACESAGRARHLGHAQHQSCSGHGIGCGAHETRHDGTIFQILFPDGCR